jgi:flagellar M-ring protein FliF
MATTEQALSPSTLTAPATAGQPALAPSAKVGLPTLAGGRGVALADGTPAKLVSAVTDIFQQPAVRKAMPAIVVLVALVIFGALYAWTQEVPYRTLFPGMVEADQQTALDTLKAANYSPRIDAASGQVMVPAGRYHEARILLASQGIPRTQGRGILDSLKDQSALTTSGFMEQARYGAAIEQELAKSITQIATIQNARVHLAQPRQSAFVRERAPVKASVIVTPYSGRLVSPQQVQAIVHLVASSVPYLAAEDVSVVDNLGSLISRSPAAGALGLTTLQAEHKAQAEENYRKRIIDLLEPVVGEGSVRAQVDLVMNFTQVETATEDYDGRKEGPKTRSEALSEERGTQLDAQGVPGSLSNRAPAPPQSTSDTAASDEKKDITGTLSSKTTRNYELDKTVRHVKSATGGIERVSVAVVIREREVSAKDAAAAKGAVAGYKAEELERLTGLVRGVVGYNQDRGDAVNLMAAKFGLVPAVSSGLAWYENDMALNGLKVLLATLVLMVILLSVVRPVLKSYFPAPQAALPSAAGALGMDEATGDADGKGEAADSETMAMAEGESLEDFKARLKKSAPPKKSSISADMLDTANTYDDKVALIRMLVQEDSGRVANVLKNMIKRDTAA